MVRHMAVLFESELAAIKTRIDLHKDGKCKDCYNIEWFEFMYSKCARQMLEDTSKLYEYVQTLKESRGA